MKTGASRCFPLKKLMEINLDTTVQIHKEVIAAEDYYTEGPIFDDQGGVFFTTLTGGEIVYWHEDHGLTRRKFDGWPNGQTRNKKGFVVCDSKNRRLVQLDHEGQFLFDVLVAQCAGKPVRSPNDVIEDAYGGLYFTDSVRHDGRVFYMSAEKEMRVVADALDYPNGLVLSDDRKYLIIAESYANRLIHIALEAPGVSKKKEVFCTLPHHPSGNPIDNLPDGLAIDQQGRIWVAHYGMGTLQIVNEAGHVLKSIPTGIPLTSNICFGTDNTLFVTGGNSEPGPGIVTKIILTNI